jgi:hypothetical protein
MSKEAKRIPIGKALPGMRIHPLPVGWEPMSAFVLIKTRDENGRDAWSYRTTEAPNREELLGALIVQADLLRKELTDEWDEEDEESVS